MANVVPHPLNRVDREAGATRRPTLPRVLQRGSLGEAPPRASRLEGTLCHNESVPESWREAAAGGNPAGGNTGRRESDQGAGAPQSEVPHLQPGPSRWLVGRYGVSTPPPEASIRSAERKAREGDWWRLVSVQQDASNFVRWCVPSRTRPGEFYTVYLRFPNAPTWWEGLRCNCLAATSGRYAVCWHKAIVVYRYEALGRRWRWKLTPP